MKDVFNPFANLHGDGCKWGITDLYLEYGVALNKALNSKEPFDTGWYGCKKEILSGRVRFDGEIYRCEASVSDDFDTEGKAVVNVFTKESSEVLSGLIMDGLNKALELAVQDQEDNKEYAGFSVHEIMADNSTGAWIETYILPTGPFGDEFPPPGDCYTKWEWQNDGDYEVDQKTRDELADWALWYQIRKDSGRVVPSTNKDVGNFRIKPWDEDDVRDGEENPLDHYNDEPE